MRTRPQHTLNLMIVALLAVVLTWAISGKATARDMFQSSPLDPGATVTSSATPVLGGIATETSILPPGAVDPAATPPALDTPIPITPEVILPTPTVEPGFLPAPTLVNPNDLTQGRPELARPGIAPAPEVVAMTPTVAPVSGAARLIDNAVLAMGYLWLCCGALFVVVLALIVVWLVRRNRRP